MQVVGDIDSIIFSATWIFLAKVRFHQGFSIVVKLFGLDILVIKNSTYLRLKFIQLQTFLIRAEHLPQQRSSKGTFIMENFHRFGCLATDAPWVYL